VEFDFADPYLECVYYDSNASIGHGPAVDKGFRKVMGIIKASIDERDLRELKGLRYEKLKGARSHQHSLRLTNQWRLIIERIEHSSQIKLRIISVEDYH
jgi:proteic killer suppression protein